MLSDLAAALALTIQPRPCREIEQGGKRSPCVMSPHVSDKQIRYSKHNVGEEGEGGNGKE